MSRESFLGFLIVGSAYFGVYELWGFEPTVVFGIAIAFFTLGGIAERLEDSQ